MAETYYSLTDIVKLCDNLVAAMPTSFYSGIWKVRNTLYRIPAADVRPVVHGKWKNVKTGYICTNCKKHPGTMHGKQGAFLSNFCPNCGADMRGD